MFPTFYISEVRPTSFILQRNVLNFKVTLYVKAEEDVAFSEIIFNNPTVQELLEAVKILVILIFYE